LGVRCERASGSHLQTTENPRKIKDLTGARRFEKIDRELLGFFDKCSVSTSELEVPVKVVKFGLSFNPKLILSQYLIKID
jgi:hypothetical protein